MDQTKIKEEPKEWKDQLENVNTSDPMFVNRQVKQECLDGPYNETCDNVYDANFDSFKEELYDKRFKSGQLSEKIVVTLNPVSNRCPNLQHTELANDELLQCIKSEPSHCYRDDCSMRLIKVEPSLDKVTSSKCSQSLGSSPDVSNLANTMKENIALSKLEDKKDQITQISLKENHRNDMTTNINTDNIIEVKIELKKELEIVTNEAEIISTPKKKKCYRDLNYENTASTSKNTHIANRNHMTTDKTKPLKKKSKANRANVISDIKPANINNGEELNLLQEKCVKYEKNSILNVESDSLLLEAKLKTDVDRNQQTNNKLLTCHNCNHKSAQKNNLHCRTATQSDAKPFACTLCCYRTNHKSSLFYHMRTHTGEKPYSCKFCDYKCNRKSHLVVHTRTHTGEKPFACQLCDFKCIIKNRLVAHMRIHTGEKPFTCNLCNFQGARKRNLDIHMRIHTGEKPYDCKVCNYKCSQKSSLISHMRTHSSEKPFSCKFCNYKCSNGSNLVSHMRTHTGEKPFSCDYCDKKFSEKCSLVYHVRTHTGERPYQCKICNFRFGRKGSLANHMMIHSGEKPFSCDHCSFTCSIKNRLIPHLMNHFGAKPFQCKLCNYKGSRKTNLVYHMRTHVGKEKPLSNLPIPFLDK